MHTVKRSWFNSEVKDTTIEKWYRQLINKSEPIYLTKMLLPKLFESPQTSLRLLILQTDASEYGIGGVLSQVDN